MLEGTPELETMKESSSYTVMFGPDKCGTTNKVLVHVSSLDVIFISLQF